MNTNSIAGEQSRSSSFVCNPVKSAGVFENKVVKITASDIAESGRNSANNQQVYTPHWITGGRIHPGLINEPPGLANVAPPFPVYRPHLPVCLCERGEISEFQFERIVYAGQAHSQRLANGARAGISIGDGTGTGKTATLAGIVLDNWFQGRKKTVWFSVKTDLIEDVREEFERIGFRIPIGLIGNYAADEPILLGEGIIFCTYKSLIAKSREGRRRLDQINDWLGREGLVIFDEGHRAKNAFAGDGGGAKPTQTGEAVLEIQDAEKRPDLRVVYSSATAASEVRHLAYQTRLGLWGMGTSFPLGFSQFAEEIEAGGVGAMEMVARDLKAMGRYFCGNLSFGTDPESGLAVEYREVIHRLTPAQREMYDNMARAWQEVLKNFQRALDLTNSGKTNRRYAVGQFWAEHQRCFRNLITAFKIPTIVREIETALGQQQSVVISLTGTGEAAAKKQIEGAIDREEAIDELDFSPRETLSRLVENCFPVEVFQEETDTATGNTIYVPVLDEAGVSVKSRAALELKRELLDRLSVLEVPEHPLDQLVNYFGTENVAEMTGRKKRLIRNLSGRLEYRKRQIPGVPNRLINLHEKNSFQNKDKRIAIMSEVAATGDSLHASRTAGNRERRLHIAAELKWSADKQVQDFGRTHRTGQTAPPIYLLVFTELGGEKRFSSVIARRLAALGALTKGDRRAARAGNLDKYDLESKPGRAALNIVLTRILDGVPIPGLADAKEALADMGLLEKCGTSGERTVKDSEKTNIPRFLNRLLSLEVERQNALFDYFYGTFLETLEYLKSKGKLGDALEDLKAVSVSISEPPQVLFTDALTGAETVYYKLETVIPTRPAVFGEISRIENVHFYRHRGSGDFVAARMSLAHTDPETGERFQMYAITSPSGYNRFYLKESELNARYKIVSKREAQQWWLDEEKKIPPTQRKTVHLLSGALLPVWKNLKRFEETGLKIVRTGLDDGTRLVGLRVSEQIVGEIQKIFGLWRCSARNAEEIIRVAREGRETVELSGGVRVRACRFQGSNVTEITASTYEQIRLLRATGLVNIIQNSRNRFFLPENETEALETLESVLKLFPPLSLIKTQGEGFSASKPLALKPDHSRIFLSDWLIEPPEEEKIKIIRP